MSPQLVFIKRTEHEKSVFGGDVYFDLDGRNIGQLSNDNQTITLTSGVHKIKMYKSHDFGTLIGFAETDIDVKEHEILAVRYSAPMLVNQPGQIVIREYDEDEINKIMKQSDTTIAKDIIKNEEHIKEQQKNSNNTALFLVIFIVIIPLIFYIISMMQIDSIYSSILD